MSVAVNDRCALSRGLPLPVHQFLKQHTDTASHRYLYFVVSCIYVYVLYMNIFVYVSRIVFQYLIDCGKHPGPVGGLGGNSTEILYT